MRFYPNFNFAFIKFH